MAKQSLLREKTAIERFKIMYRILCIITVVIILSFSVVMTGFLVYKSNANLKVKVSSLVEADTRLLSNNIDEYLDRIESTATLVFAKEDYYKYDATNAELSEYDQLVFENEIYDRIFDIGMMQNFSDFGIIYRNNHYVGWCSKTTQVAYKDLDMFGCFEQAITNQSKQDGWFFGRVENVDRVYYVKRINENAILFTSFYNREFKERFEITDQIEDMVIELVDDDNVIIFSTDSESIGSSLDSEIIDELDGKEDVTIADRRYIVSSSTCSNGWRLISYIPMDSFFKANKDVGMYAISFAVLLSIIFTLITIYGFRTFTKPIKNMVTQLEEDANYDKLSGVLNKGSFENTVRLLIKNKIQKGYVAFLTIDMDNFKKVNDVKGHAYGDKVIKQFGHMLDDIFKGVSLVGRIGGDEFAVYYNDGDSESFGEFESGFREHLELLEKRFKKLFENEIEALELGVSGGVCSKSLEDTETISFEDLFKKSDDALYKSKKQGKNQITWHREDSDEKD